MALVCPLGFCQGLHVMWWRAYHGLIMSVYVSPLIQLYGILLLSPDADGGGSLNVHSDDIACLVACELKTSSIPICPLILTLEYVPVDS